MNKLIQLHATLGSARSDLDVTLVVSPGVYLRLEQQIMSLSDAIVETYA